MPGIQIRGKNTVAQELLPVRVEGSPFAVVGELGREDGFDILRVGGEDCSDASGARFDGVFVRAVSIEGGEEGLPGL